jgi:hypothetical protein
LFLPAVAILIVAPAHAGDEQPLGYRIETVYRAPSGDLVKTQTDAVQIVPSLVDVDHDIATGNAGADVLVQLTIDAGRATLRVTKLPGAAATLPLSVEAILPDPRRDLPIPILGQPDEALRVAFGYDALASTAPSAYDATLAIAGTGRVTSFSLDLHTAAAGDTIGVTAEVFTEGSGGERLDPIKGRVDYAPVPTAAHFGVLSGSDIGQGIGAGQASIDLASDVPTTAGVTIDDIQGDDQMHAEARIDKVPHTMSLVLTTVEETGQTTFSYRASARVGVISVDITETSGGDITSDTVLEVRDMALSATLVQDAPNHATFQSESPIGVVKAGFATGGRVRFLDDPAYLHQFTDATIDSLSFQVLGLTAAEVGTGDPFVVGATMAPGPFRVSIIDGSATTEARFIDLPGTVRLSGSPSQGTLHYSASGPVDTVTIDATDPAGIAGRATAMHVLLRQLPTEIDLDYGEDNNTVSLDANGATLGLIEVQLTSGPDERLDGSVDGVLVNDLADRYVVFARVNQLRKVVASTDDERIDLQLDTAAARVFKADVNQTNASGDPTYVRATIDRLPSSVHVTYDPAAGTVNYSGSSRIDSIVVDAFDPDGLSGRATTAHVLLQDIPETLTLGFTPGASSVSIDANGQTLGLIEAFLTSGPLEQLDPSVDGVLYRDLSDRYVVFGRVTGLRRVSIDEGPPPSLALDTTGGRIFVVDIALQKPGGIATTAARIDRLPSSLSAHFSNATTFAYTASSGVSLVTLDAYDPDGISNRATALHARLVDLPNALDVAADPNGTMTLDAKGQTLGLLEFQLTSGPDDRIASSFDGLLLNDLQDRYVMFARITGLKKVVATQQPQPNVTLQTTGGRILKVELNEWNGSKVEYTRATLTSLVPSVTIRFIESGTKQEITYTASAPTTSIVLDTNSGDRWNMHASIANPLPASVYFCQSDGSACNGGVRSAGAGAFKFDASEHTTVNLFDCVRPLNSNCTGPDPATEFTYVSNLRIRHLDMDADASSSGESGYIFMNTTSGGVHHTMTGYLLNENGSGGGFEADFGSGFWAENRHGRWSLWGLSKTKSGSINCNASLAVRVIGLWIGVTSYLC